MFAAKTKSLNSLLGAESGYSLLEILISVAIFAIGILGIAGLQIRATNTDTHSRLLTEAYAVATDQVEEIMLMSYSDSNITNGRHPTSGFINAGPSNRYSLWYQVTDDNPVNNCKFIQVFVRINASSIGFSDAANQAHVRIDYVKPEIQNLKS